jgi:hypothetical protein
LPTASSTWGSCNKQSVHNDDCCYNCRGTESQPAQLVASTQTQVNCREVDPKASYNICDNKQQPFAAGAQHPWLYSTEVTSACQEEATSGSFLDQLRLAFAWPLDIHCSYVFTTVRHLHTKRCHLDCCVWV